MAATTPFTLTTPLPAADLFFASMSHSSGFSVLEETQLQLLSPLATIDAKKLLGKPLDLAVRVDEDTQRHIGGLITRFSVGRHHGRWFGYEATVRPWLWLLTRTSDCFIFQDMTVPDIVTKVFQKYQDVATYDFKLQRSYRKRVYCVQYRETDFNFIARLLEDEGIYWYFDHSPRGPKLVLVDDPGSHAPVAGTTDLPYFPLDAQVPHNVEYIGEWHHALSIKPGRSSLTSYDFEHPSTPLMVSTSHARGHDQDRHELYDFQGDYTIKSDGDHLAQNRLEEHQRAFSMARGHTNAYGLAAGYTFNLKRHPSGDQNGKYLCTQVHVTAHDQGAESGDGAPDLHCHFEAQPAAEVFRPPRRTPKPFVQGPQTAVVVGPGGEEIYTDKYARVKVQFHWDRVGHRGADSSCWVRVSSPWAGKNFGFIQIPRIGQEVVVDFLEGDPDQPLITGRVYNAEQMPPWDLPANATQSGVLSRSSKNGGYGNANALRFEDKKGSEQVWLHAEKNQDIEVENDETHWVGHDRKKTIDHDETTHVKHDRTENVDNNEKITIGVNRTENVGSNENITIGSNRTESVGSNESITIGANRSETVGANESINIGANRSITVGASETATVALQRTHAVGTNETIAIGAAQEVAIGAVQTITVGAMQSISVGASQSTSVGANQTTDVGANRSVTVGGAQTTSVSKARTTSVGESDSLKVSKSMVVDAGDAIVLKTGSASITMKKDGTIVIKGKDITIDGSGKINIKASGDVTVKGSKVQQN